MTDGAVAGRRRLTRPDVLWRWGGRTVIALATQVPYRVLPLVRSET